MAAFPSSPTNGQTVNINNITYVYNSTLGVWDQQGTVAGASPVASVAGRTGAVTLTAADIGAGTFSGTYTITTLNVSNAVTAASFSGAGTGLTGTASSLSIGGTAATATSATTATNLSGGSVSGTTGLFSSTLQTTSLGVGTTPTGTTGQILATNAITAYYSDARLKEEIGTIENALDKIDQLAGILYTQNKLAEQFGYNNYEQQVGLRAQDVQRVQPEAVKLAPFDMNPDGSSKSGENYLTIQYERLIPLLIEGIKELRVEINQLKGQ